MSSLEQTAFRWSVLADLFVDLSLLCTMFLGMLHKKNATYLWRMLYLQGVFWILTAIFTEVVSDCLCDAPYDPTGNLGCTKDLPFMNMDGM